MNRRKYEPQLEAKKELAPLTTLGLGGSAAHFLSAASESEITAGIEWAADSNVPVTILGGGSNVVVPDSGLDGLVIQIATRGIRIQKIRGAGAVRVTVQAGQLWDDFVERMVDAGFAGLECLAGIPGLVGATPIQNVGAYGQEVSETIESVHVLDRQTLEARDFTGAECDFSYRNSRFKKEPHRYVVLSVSYRLVPGGAPAMRYAELNNALEPEAVTLRAVTDTVRTLRAKKSMVIDPEDENRRSVGSFFTNPILDEIEAHRVFARAVALGRVKQADEVPRFPTPDGRIKVPAGWLIENSGMQKGFRYGSCGISTKHALALVHHGGGSTGELLELAALVRDRVHEAFDVELSLEPVLLGGLGI